MKSETTIAWPWALLATCAAYALVGVAALQLTLPPGHAMPLFPSSGLALVTVLVYGRRVLPGIWAGSTIVSLAFLVSHGWLMAIGPTDLIGPAVIGIGSALQAAVGAWLLRRYSFGPLTLTEPSEIARLFLLGGALACIVAPSLAVLVMAVGHTVPVAELPQTWATWWMGDTLGVLIGAPIALTLVGRPRTVWAARRLSVALPMVLVTSLAVLAILRARAWDEERAQVLFDRDARSVQAALTERLQDPLSALEAMNGLFIGSDSVTRSDFRRASKAWLDGAANLNALGWSERIQGNQIAAFEAAVRSDGPADYAVFARGRNGEKLAPEGRELMPVRYIEPDRLAATALGGDSLSVDLRRQAIDDSRRDDRPAATAGFAPLPESPEQISVVIYRAIYADADTPADERTAKTRGAVFVSLRMDETLRAVLASLPAYLRVCLVDASRSGVQRRLAGDPGCDGRVAKGPLMHTGDIGFAGRTWQVHIDTQDGMAPPGNSHSTWMFAIVSLIATATFGVLLLTMTGRALRIASAVDERTAELRREIDERARTETALRDSEQRFRNILDHIPIGVMYTDMRGNIKQSNPKFRALVGYNSEELSQRRSLDLVHPEDRTAALDLVEQLVQGDVDFYQRQARYVRRDGHVLWVRDVVSLLRDDAGQPHRIVAVVEDIGEQLKLRDAEDAREIAEAANNAKNDFLSRMSLELRAPLSAMLGFAELIERDRETEASNDQRRWIGQIHQAASGLLGLVDDTLDLARVESGAMHLVIETLALAEIVDARLAAIEATLLRRELILTRNLADDAAQVRGDAERVAQIIGLLLANAIAHTPDGGRIRIESRRSGGYAELEITDGGPGLNDEQLAGLFQPFSRRGREASAKEGAGLGLIVCRRLAELMNGELNARSTPDRGAGFVLKLPTLAHRPTNTPSGQGAFSDEPLDHYQTSYRQRIVHYIEDNETNALVMEGILAQRPQIKLRVSVNGLDGLAAIRSRPPSLILLDMHLPDIDGLQLLRMLKDDPSTAGIPIVVVSADAVVARIQAALEAGAEYYLTKPVNVAELLRLLDGVLEPQDTLFG